MRYLLQLIDDLTFPTSEEDIEELKREIIENDLKLQLYNRGYTDVDISERAGISKQAVASWRSSHGLKPNVKDTRLELHFVGLTDSEIAKEIDVTVNAVIGWRIRLSLKDNKPLESTHLDKLELYKLGYSDSMIANEFDLSERSVSNWRYKNKLPINKE